MSEINAEIKKLIFEGRREEAIDELMNSYSLDRDKAEEFVRRFEEANKKKIKPGVAQNLAKGCGCISIFFVIAFALALFTGIRGVLNDVKVEAEVIGYETEEFTDQFDAKIETYYTPQVRYTYEGETYEVSMTSDVSTEAEFSEGETIVVYIDPEYPDLASTYDVGNAIGDASVWLILAAFAFGGYWLIRNVSAKINKPLQEMQEKMEEMKAKAAELAEQAEQEKLNQEAGAADQSEVTFQEEKPKKEFITTPKSQKEIKEVNPLILSAIGLVLILVGVGLGYWKYTSNQHAAMLLDGESVIAEVVRERRINVGTSSDRRYEYEYDFEYQYNGKYYSYTQTFSFDDYNNGDKVELMINPDNPEDAAVNRSDDLSRGGSYFWGFALIFLGGWCVKWGFDGHKRWQQKRRI